MGAKETRYKENSEDDVAVYITFNGIPLFHLPDNPNDDNYIITSSFLHIIDLPVISVLVKGNGSALEMSRYRADLNKLDLEITD